MPSSIAFISAVQLSVGLHPCSLSSIKRLYHMLNEKAPKSVIIASWYSPLSTTRALLHKNRKIIFSIFPVYVRLFHVYHTQFFNLTPLDFTGFLKSHIVKKRQKYVFSLVFITLFLRFFGGLLGIYCSIIRETKGVNLMLGNALSPVKWNTKSGNSSFSDGCRFPFARIFYHCLR